jgi:DNA-directed RNA polymerase sigma subunit (sigma70/sigma32)
MGMPVKKIRTQLTRAKVVISLDAPLTSHSSRYSDAEPATLHDYLEAPSTENDEVVGAGWRDTIMAYVNRLPQNLRRVIMMRFLDGEDRTLDEVGEHISNSGCGDGRKGIGVSRERVRQLQVQAFKMLRPALKKAIIDVEQR